MDETGVKPIIIFFVVMNSKRQVKGKLIARYKLTFAVGCVQGDSKSYVIWTAIVDSSTFYFREGHHPVCPQDRYPIPHEGGVSNLFCYKLLEDTLSHHTERRLSHFMWFFFQSSMSPFPIIIYLYHYWWYQKHLAPVVPKLENAIYWINPYAVGNATVFSNAYRLDSDLFVG